MQGNLQHELLSAMNQHCAIMQDGGQHCATTVPTWQLDLASGTAAGDLLCKATSAGITESCALQPHCWTSSTPGSCPWASSRAWATVWDPRAAAMCSAVDPRESQGV